MGVCICIPKETGGARSPGTEVAGSHEEGPKVRSSTRTLLHQLLAQPSLQPPELMEQSIVYTGWCRDLAEVMTEQQMAAILLGRRSLVLCLSAGPGHEETEKEKPGGGSGGGGWALGSLWHAGNSPVNTMGSLLPQAGSWLGFFPLWSTIPCSEPQNSLH